MSETGAQEARREPLRLLIADDHALFRGGLRQILDEEEDIEVLGEAASAEEALERVHELRPRGLNLVLMDVEMPGMGGIEGTRRLRAEHPDLPVVVLTASSLEADLLEAVQAGASGFLGKNLSPAAMVRALRDYLHEGALPMPPPMAARVIAYFQQATAGRLQSRDEARAARAIEAPHGPLDELTPREREVMELVAEGLRDREIAERLTISEHTAKRHVQSILQKLDVRSRTEAVGRYRREER